MIVDLIRAGIQLIFRDKIVAGIVIVGILGIFFCGVSNKDPNGHRMMSGANSEHGAAEGSGEGGGKAPGEAQPQGQGDAHGQATPQAQGQGQGQDPGQPQGQAQGQAAGQNPQIAAAPQPPEYKLPPKLAVDFTRWWLTMALDYSVNSPGNHKKAMAYAKPNVAKMFAQSFYTPDVMAGVANGTLAGSFEPVTVQAIAVNPDGTVVVSVIGTLSMQSSGSQPVSQSLVLEFLVEKAPEGVHMAGFFNKTVTQPPAPTQQAAPVDPGPPQFLGQ